MTSLQPNIRLIIDPPASGAYNMAVDEAILIDAAENGTATLRLYSWNEPTLSLGYFQRYADREQHSASLSCAVVRRQTGGGAILHDRELTYSLALPPNHPLSKQNEKLYRIVHEVFIDVLWPRSRSGLPCALQIRGERSKNHPGDGPLLCFQRQSPGDVVFVAEDSRANTVTLSQAPSLPRTTKILGSAQRRYHGAVLQHGSLLLARSPAAPELAGWNELAAPFTVTDSVISAVGNRLGEALDLQVQKAKLPRDLELIAIQIANNRYGSASWTKRR